MQSRKKVLRPNGFTLLEVCFVLSILGTLATFMFSSMVPTAYSVRAELDRLHAFCVYLQRRAQIEKEQQSIDFNAHGYRCSGLFEVIFPPRISLRTTLKNDKLQVSSEGTLSSGSVFLTDGAVSYVLTIDVAAIRGLRRYRSHGAWVCLDDNHQVH